MKSNGDVCILDNRNRVAPQITDLSDLQVYENDVGHYQSVFEILSKVRPRVVFHLAALHYIPECNADPERTLRVNLEGSQTILRASVEAGVSHFVYASTGAVYADSPLPLSESSPVAPVDIYGWSKLFGESLCSWHAEQSSMKITVARLFNNYGPRETNPHIIPEVISQLRSGDELQLGNIKPRRDYIHTRDTAKALRLLAERPPDSFRIVNVASGHHASVEELLEVLEDLLHRKLIIHCDSSRYRKSDKLVQMADISCLASTLGWSPEVGLRDGLRDLLRFEGLLP